MGKGIKKNLKKMWWFIWEDNSIWSWILNIILAFVIIKFLVYPALGFALNTSHPIVAVVSGSMEHKTAHPCALRDSINPTICLSYDRSKYEICGNMYDSRNDVDVDFFWDACGAWYIENSITKEEFNKMSFRNGFNKGDIMVLFGTKPKNIEKGDIIVFTGYRQEPIIHRVIKKTQEDGYYHFQTKGDHNQISYDFESDIPEGSYIGRAVIRIPWLGYVKILAVDLINIMR